MPFPRKLFLLFLLSSVTRAATVPGGIDCPGETAKLAPWRNAPATAPAIALINSKQVLSPFWEDDIWDPDDGGEKRLKPKFVSKTRNAMLRDLAHSPKTNLRFPASASVWRNDRVEAALDEVDEIFQWVLTKEVRDQPPAKKEATAIELAERILRLLDAAGVNSTVVFERPTKQNPRLTLEIEIDREGKHPLNRRAKSIWDGRRQARLIFSAMDQIEIPTARGGYDDKGNVIHLSVFSLRHLDPNEQSLNHESRHALNFGDPNRNWGIVSAWDHPKETTPSVAPNSYAIFQSLDEMDTYRYETRKTLDKVCEQKWDSGFLLEDAVDHLRMDIKLGREVAYRAKIVAEEGLKAVKAQMAVYDPGDTVPVVSIVQPGYRVDMPLNLPAGSSETVQKKALIEKLTRLELVAWNHAVQFDLARFAMERLEDPDLPPGARLAMLEALRGSLRPWTSPELPPALDLEEKIQDFNQLVHFHYGRINRKPALKPLPPRRPSPNQTQIRLGISGG